MKLLDIECKRDPRVEDYVYRSFDIDNASEYTIAAFQAGLIAGARLLRWGHIESSGD
jgi:hypothetical protein